MDASPQWQCRPHLEQMRLLAYFWQRGDEAQPGCVCAASSLSWAQPGEEMGFIPPAKGAQLGLKEARRAPCPASLLLEE